MSVNFKQIEAIQLLEIKGTYMRFTDTMANFPTVWQLGVIPLITTLLMPGAFIGLALFICSYNNNASEDHKKLRVFFLVTILMGASGLFWMLNVNSIIAQSRLTAEADYHGLPIGRTTMNMVGMKFTPTEFIQIKDGQRLMINNDGRIYKLNGILFENELVEEMRDHSISSLPTGTNNSYIVFEREMSLWMGKSKKL